MIWPKKWEFLKRPSIRTIKNKTKLVEQTTSSLFTTISNGIDIIQGLNKNPIEELYEIKKFVMLHLKNEKSSPTAPATEILSENL